MLKELSVLFRWEQSYHEDYALTYKLSIWRESM